MKCFRCCVMSANGNVMSRSTKEAMRIIDTKKKEDECAKEKFGHNHDFADVEARNSFRNCATSIIKYLYRYDHCGLRDALIDNNMIEAICSRCFEIETWENIIKHSKSKVKRVEFVMKMMSEMIKCKPKDIEIDKIMLFTKGMLRHVEGETEEEYNAN